MENNEIIQFYSTANPNVGEIVLVQFTQKMEAFFDAVLVEYPYRGIMNYQDATKKRKVKSWNEHVPLNKNMVALVDEIDEEKKIVKLSLAYLDNYVESENRTELANPSFVQQQLIIHFNENKMMENFMKSLCIMHNLDLKDIWTRLIYYIDSQRREEGSNDSLWKFFTDNFESLDEWVKSTNLSIQISEDIKKLYQKRIESTKKIATRFGIVSLGGTQNTKILLKNVLENIEFKYILKYDSTPYYILESYSNDSSEEDHLNILNSLKLEAEKFDPKVFIKTD
jgi:translation initiation factor 2 alpha subunit (eIF-2alpha)